MVLKAFFDETGTHAGHPVIGVAGFLYDDRGIEQFNTRWKKRASELDRPFHTSECFYGRGQFAGWPEPMRMLLMHDLADIIAETKLAGFLTYIERNDWEVWKKTSQPAIVESVGSPYSACLLHCISLVDSFADVRHPNEKVFYVFEAGCDREPEAREFLCQIERNEQSAKNLKLAGHEFSSRGKEPILSGADFLAWEWQRHYVEYLRDGKRKENIRVRSEMQLLLRGDIYVRGLVDGSLSARALINLFHEHQPISK
jgi:hypothetical protein